MAEGLERDNNPYLYDASGPKKRIDYSKPDGGGTQDEDMTSFDLDA